MAPNPYICFKNSKAARNGIQQKPNLLLEALPKAAIDQAATPSFWSRSLSRAVKIDSSKMDMDAGNAFLLWKFGQATGAVSIVAIEGNMEVQLGNAAAHTNTYKSSSLF